MAKLSPQQIREIVQKFSQGTPVSLLSKEYGITNMVVYYHTKKYKVYKKRKPMCYKDYLINKICDLQEQYQTADDFHKMYLRDEIIRIEKSFNIDRQKSSASPFLFQ
jgi:hypothetical protein